MSMRCAASLLLAVLAGAGCTEEVFTKPSGAGSWVLADLFHTDLQNPIDYRLDRGVYEYQGVHGYSRLFDHLGAHGYPWTATRTYRIDAELLDGFSVLFINLLHESAPDFRPEEIEAIHEFVAAGGGLFVIADHSNVYRHAERLNPLLQPMGIEVTYHSALDTDSVAGSAWILLRNHAEHPINEGIELISFQTGGTLETQSGTTFLSEQGFGDLWDESNTEGFYGNWTYDGDETLEPKGATTPVVAAAEYGAGRVMVVGDQNIYGDVWLHFGDNFSHALNGFEWLAGREGQDELPLRARPVSGMDMGVELSRSGYALGQGGLRGYYGLFHHLNRHQGVSARAETHLDRDRDVLWLPTPREAYSSADIEALQAHLQKGRRVVLSLELSRLTGASVDLLRALAPGFGLQTQGQDLDVGGPAEAVAARLTAIPTVEGRQALLVHAVRCEGYDFWPPDLGALQVAGLEGDSPERMQPVLRAVTSAWGQPLFSVSGADLVRRKRIGGGELVVIMQDNLLRSGTLGAKESSPPPAGSEHAVEFLYGLLDYLLTPVGCS